MIGLLNDKAKVKIFFGIPSTVKEYSPKKESFLVYIL